nr:DUF4012 domain-containing protein [Candidatus Gracilibacteria bacterium]
MRKNFDLTGLPQTSWWRRLRIHPQFDRWMQEIRLFFGFLLIIALISTGIGFYLSSQNWISKIKPQIQELKTQKDKFKLEQFVQSSRQIIAEIPPLPLSQHSEIQGIVEQWQKLIEEAEWFVNNPPETDRILEEIKQGKTQESYLYWQNAYPHLLQISQSLDTLKPEIRRWQSIFPDLSQYLAKIPPQFTSKNLADFNSSLSDFLGMQSPHHLIIWLQNAYESRGSGGFIGSFLSLKIEKGEISQVKSHDIYEFDRQIRTKIWGTPDLAKTLVGQKFWSLRDSNYHPDFRVSAESFIKFAEKTDAPAIDTIIAIDQTLIEDILQKLGPIAVKQIEIRAENFSPVVSYLTEGKFSSPNPKKFLLETIVPAFFQQKMRQIDLAFLKQNWQNWQNHLKIYSKLPNLSGFLQNQKIGNPFLNHDFKNPYIQKISISGNKSDQYQEEKWSFKTLKPHIQEIRLHRKHLWGAKQE